MKGEPRAAPAHCLAGAILNTLGRRKDALTSYDRALAIAPNLAVAWNDRGNTLRLLQRPQDALASYDRATALEPGSAQWHNNRGAALAEMGRLEDAIASYDRALQLQPTFAEALSNRGAALLKLDRPEAALADVERALALRPDGAEARYAAATALLALGEFDEGRRAYEARWSKADLAPFRRTLPRPLWLGDAPIEGKTILLHAEQGFGDRSSSAATPRASPRVARPSSSRRRRRCTICSDHWQASPRS